MSLSAGNKTIIQEVVDAVIGKINDEIKNVDNGGTGTVWSGEPTMVTWGGTKADITSFNSQKSAAFLKTKTTKPATADDTYQFIMECMWNACRVYIQTYSYYANVGFLNKKIEISTILSSESFEGFHESAYYGGTLDQYKADTSLSAIDRPENLYKGRLMTASDITTLINNLAEYNAEQKEKHKDDHGIRNTCYTSCHSSCHGASRGRR